MGLIHVSEFGSIEELKNALPVQSTHEFLIGSIKPADKRLILKLPKKGEPTDGSATKAPAAQ